MSIEKAKQLPSRISRSIHLALILIIMFGASAVSKAASKLKRLMKNGRSFLRASQSAHLMANPWGYFLPAWENSGAKVRASSLPTAVAQRENIVADPDSRIDRDFRVPSRVRDQVNFWIEVYSRFSSEYRIVHDRTNPSIIYGYIDLRPIYRAIHDPIAADGKAYLVEKKILKEMKARFSEAMELSPSGNLPLGEKESIRKMFSHFGASDKNRAQLLIRNIRTQTGQADIFLKAIHRSRGFLPQIEEIFRSRGIPVALARIPFVESSFNRRALSKAGAAGIWQFTPETSLIFCPSGTAEEWADPIKQSKNAARLLLWLRKKLPDWGTAVTAYNSGGGRLVQIVEKHRVRGFEDLFELPTSKDTLGFAGKNFYLEFLAATIVEAYKDKLFPVVAVFPARQAAISGTLKRRSPI